MASVVKYKNYFLFLLSYYTCLCIAIEIQMESVFLQMFSIATTCIILIVIYWRIITLDLRSGERACNCLWMLSISFDSSKVFDKLNHQIKNTVCHMIFIGILDYKVNWAIQWNFSDLLRFFFTFEDLSFQIKIMLHVFCATWIKTK